MGDPILQLTIGTLSFCVRLLCALVGNETFGSNHYALTHSLFGIRLIQISHHRLFSKPASSVWDEWYPVRKPMPGLSNDGQRPLREQVTDWSWKSKMTEKTRRSDFQIRRYDHRLIDSCSLPGATWLRISPFLVVPTFAMNMYRIPSFRSVVSCCSSFVFYRNGA